MSRQLHRNTALLLCEFGRPQHHFTTNPLPPIFFVNADRFFSTELPALMAEGRGEGELQRTDHLPVNFRDDQFVVRVGIDLFECP